MKGIRQSTAPSGVTTSTFSSNHRHKRATKRNTTQEPEMTFRKGLHVCAPPVLALSLACDLFERTASVGPRTTVSKASSAPPESASELQSQAAPRLDPLNQFGWTALIALNSQRVFSGSFPTTYSCKCRHATSTFVPMGKVVAGDARQLRLVLAVTFRSRRCQSGPGIGASHQTGWTGLVAKLVEQSGEGM